MFPLSLPKPLPLCPSLIPLSFFLSLSSSHYHPSLYLSQQPFSCHLLLLVYTISVCPSISVKPLCYVCCAQHFACWSSLASIIIRRKTTTYPVIQPLSSILYTFSLSYFNLTLSLPFSYSFLIAFAITLHLLPSFLTSHLPSHLNMPFNSFLLSHHCTSFHIIPHNIAARSSQLKLSFPFFPLLIFSYIQYILSLSLSNHRNISSQPHQDVANSGPLFSPFLPSASKSLTTYSNLLPLT